MKTLTVKKKWFDWLKEHSLATSGEGVSLLRMRRAMWGDDALVVRCNKYLFKVSEDVFLYIKRADG